MKTRNDIGNNIRRLRLAAGMSQTDVAEVCGIEKSRLSRYENGFVIPRVDTIEVLATALKVKPQEIVGWI